MDFTESYISRCSSVGLACRVGDCESLRRLLEGGAPPDVHDNRGWYPVHEAAYGLHADCLSLLVRDGSLEIFCNALDAVCSGM